MTPEQIRERCDLIAGTYHFTCEDSWYSCPLSEDGCADDRQEAACNCGLDGRRKRAVEVLLQVEREAMAAGLERAALHFALFSSCEALAASTWCEAEAQRVKEGK